MLTTSQNLARIFNISCWNPAVALKLMIWYHKNFVILLCLFCVYIFLYSRTFFCLSFFVWYINIHIYIYIYIYIPKWKTHFRRVMTLQPTNSNVKLFQCYGIFLTSRNLSCTKVKNTPQYRNDSAHQKTFQKPSTPQVQNGAGTLASLPPVLKHKTVVYFPLPH